MPQALSYHLKVAAYFKQQQKTWDFFAARNTRNDQLTNFKLDLLKNTYKFNPETDNSIFTKVETVKSRLGLPELPVHIYQAQFTEEMNASIVYLDGESHIVFSGRIMQLLDEQELLAVIAHELAHVKLYTMQAGDLEIADRIISAIANNHHSENAYIETARLFRLYTEIFCDRCAYLVLENTAAVITSLVKIATGLQQVSSENYVAQAAEIFSADQQLKAGTLTHPENFIRASAIQLWHEQKEAANPVIESMIEGAASLDSLDIFKQQELSIFTKQFLQLFLRPVWFHTPLVLSQVRQFFSDFLVDEKVMLTKEMIATIAAFHPSIKEYLCYLLMDFIKVDRNLENVPFGWAFQFAEDLQLKETFDAIIKKEMKFSDKKLQQHKKMTLADYYAVKEGVAEQIYEG